MANVDPTQDPTLTSDSNAPPPQIGAVASAPLPAGGGDPSMPPSTTYVDNNTGTSAPFDPNAKPAPPPPDPNAPYALGPKGVLQEGRDIISHATQESKDAQAHAQIASQGAQEQTGIYGQKISEAVQYATDHRKLADVYNTEDATARAQDEKDWREAGNMKTDPNHWWNSKDTGSKAAAVIGLILGGFGQGLQMYGGNKQAHNMALDTMDQAIKDDIDSQDKNRTARMDALTHITGIHKDSAAAHALDLADKQQQFLLGQQRFADMLSQATSTTADKEAQQRGLDALTTLQGNIITERANMTKSLQALANAGAAQLAALQKYDRDRKDKQEDAAATLAGEVLLEQHKAGDAATAKEAEHTQTVADAAQTRAEQQRTFLAGMKVLAESGEEPSPQDIAEGAKLGVAIPKISKSAWNPFGTTKNDVDKVYDSLAPTVVPAATAPAATAPAATAPAATAPAPAGLPSSLKFKNPGQ